MAIDTVWSNLSADPRDPASAVLRANDSDRHVVSSALADAYADGRLDRGEYDERSDRAVTVKVLGDFVPLLADLTRATPSSIVRRATSIELRDQARQKYARELRDARSGFLGTSAICLTIWVVTSIASGGPYFFWPIFPIAGVGLGFVMMFFNRESRTEAIWEKLAETKRQEREIDGA